MTDGSRPRGCDGVQRVAISSNDSDDTYGLSDTIRVSVTFSEAVDVTGAPRATSPC